MKCWAADLLSSSSLFPQRQTHLSSCCVHCGKFLFLTNHSFGPGWSGKHCLLAAQGRERELNSESSEFVCQLLSRWRDCETLRPGFWEREKQVENPVAQRSTSVSVQDVSHWWRPGGHTHQGHTHQGSTLCQWLLGRLKRKSQRRVIVRSHQRSERLRQTGLKVAASPGYLRRLCLKTLTKTKQQQNKTSPAAAATRNSAETSVSVSNSHLWCLFPDVK